MKKIIALVGLVALMAGFTACTRTQTELSSNAISTKVQVYGFIEVATGNGDNDEFTGTADVFYRSAAGNPKPGFSHTQVNVRDGEFHLELGCPAGEALEVKVQASTMDDAKVGGDTKEAYFFGTNTKTVNCGSAVYVRVILGPVVFTEDPDSNTL